LMRVTDKEYQNHPVFDDLERYIAFYERLSQSVFHWITVGTRAICNIDSYVFSSIKGTLLSIMEILRAGRINDAYALLRKYHDSAIINIYTNLYLEDKATLENFIVEQIDNWTKGVDQLPEYRKMYQFIIDSSSVAPITTLLFKDKRYKKIRERCNDHTHYNFYKNVLLNDSEIILIERVSALNEFRVDMRDLLILHSALLFFAKDHYMMSSDYVDALDCGMTPEPDSEYWVAPFVQKFFKQTIEKHRPDIAKEIKENTNMQLE